MEIACITQSDINWPHVEALMYVITYRITTLLDATEVLTRQSSPLDEGSFLPSRHGFQLHEGEF